MKVDKRFVSQIVYHLLKLDIQDEELRDKLHTKDLIEIANTFHRVEECGSIKMID